MDINSVSLLGVLFGIRDKSNTDSTQTINQLQTKHFTIIPATGKINKVTI
ncbi:MAG: hypothetical protein ACK5L7_02695 [Paludibacteraceae bacterium]